MKEIVIVSAKRTPIGSFCGSLSSVSAPALGGFAVKSVLEQSGINPQLIEELYFGNVLPAGLGQAPATQVAKYAALNDIPATIVNKVCASGAKAVMLAAGAIASGEREILIAGGMESMSNVPYYAHKIRTGHRLGDMTLTDGLIKDGLWDVYHNYHMGSAAELCAATYKITREQQDAYAIKSYQKAQKALSDKKFDAEICPITRSDKKGTTVIRQDEEPTAIQWEKVSTLRPAFQKEGTVTAANASTLSDGAAALLLTSSEKAKTLGLKPLAKIIAYADAQQAPEWFTTCPAKAIHLALNKTQLTISDIDFFEINEAFSVVAIANNQLLNLDDNKVNIYGGAVALGHPLGASGARIIVTLLSVLRQNGGKYGVAGICNGGGGASAIVIENCF